MFLSYFDPGEQPFGFTPDPRYLFQSETHREALASLRFGIEAGCGFTALVAEAGMGKTTLLLRCLSQLPAGYRTVFLCQTIPEPLDLLRAVLQELGSADIQGDYFQLQSSLNQLMVEYSRRGERILLVIDEAQNLSEPVLELVRMLSNCETSREKLIQIVLAGQPGLARKLASPRLVQLRQRISILSQLRAFTPEETALYIEHRLRVAGYSADCPLFTDEALRLIATKSSGIPRNINTLCFNALSLACALQRRPISAALVHEVAGDRDLAGALRAGGAGVGTRMFLAREWCAKLVRSPWFPKAAIGVAAAEVALVVVMVSGGSKPGVRVTIEQRATGTGAAMVQARAKAAHQGAIHNSGVAGRPGTESRVVVTRGMTLDRICVESLGNCSARELEAIYRLNPWMEDPDYLEAGRILRIPSRDEIEKVRLDDER